MGEEDQDPELSRSTDAAACGSTVEAGRSTWDLETLLEEHGDAILAFCARTLRDEVLAEDVAQQVFLEATRDLARFEGRSKMRSWLFGIAAHRCQDAIRARRRRMGRIVSDVRSVEDFADPAVETDRRLTKGQELAALEECVAKLGDDARLAVLLRFRAEMSYEEMAPRLGAKPDTLHARVTRALPILRKCLERKGWRSGG